MVAGIGPSGFDFKDLATVGALVTVQLVEMVAWFQWGLGVRANESRDSNVKEGRRNPVLVEPICTAPVELSRFISLAEI